LKNKSGLPCGRCYQIGTTNGGFEFAKGDKQQWRYSGVALDTIKSKRGSSPFVVSYKPLAVCFRLNYIRCNKFALK
jgi:hypothetical protein